MDFFTLKLLKSSIFRRFNVENSVDKVENTKNNLIIHTNYVNIAMYIFCLSQVYFYIIFHLVFLAVTIAKTNGATQACACANAVLNMIFIGLGDLF